MTSLFDLTMNATASSTTIGHFLHNHEEGSLYFNEEYQREYVWGKEEQQAFLGSLFGKVPLDAVAVVENSGSHEEFLEVVDGRQRITTAVLFYTNKIPYIKDDKEYYFSDLSRFDKSEFKKTRLPVVELTSVNREPVSLKAKMKFFYITNFSGVPQSEEHRLAILQKMEAL